MALVATLVAALVVLGPAAAAAGPSIGLVSAPRAARVGEAVPVTISVARRPKGARVTVWIRRAGQARSYAARAAGGTRYRARVVFPAAGRWTLGARVGAASRALRSVEVAEVFRVREPFRVVAASDGSLLVADGTVNRILRVDPSSGATSSFAGTGSAAPPTPGADARTSSVGRPLEVAVARDGTVAFVSDEKVWRIDPATSRIGRLAADVQLAGPTSLAFDAAGNLLVAEYGGYVRRIDAATGATRTIAGIGVERSSGDGGPAVAAGIDRPHGIAVGGDGAIYVSDSYSNRVRRIALDGTISTFAGDGSEGTIGGPTGLFVASDGAVYVAETFAGRISRLDGTGRIVRVAAVSQQPTGVVLLPDGRLVASLVGPVGSGAGMLVRIDPSTGAVSRLTR
jgi:sugar lactone lactonase YvrE